MKKKFMITAEIAALTLVGVYLGKSATGQTGGLSDLQLANAEALAQYENQGIPIPCHSSGGINILKRYTDCSTCTPVVAYKGEGTEGQCYPR